MIFKAAVYDAKILTDIALKSKAFWGYSQEELCIWIDELTITSKTFDECNIYKYIIKDKIVGFYVLERANIRTSFLNFLFISPQYIKHGIGSKLLCHAIENCIEGSCAILNVLSDPNAEGFYAKHGFKVVNKIESSIKGRFLPEMELEFLENQ
ncbi:GNAT family N-acetyltransferase [Polaribacter sp. MSW13]|uniref:GNAT family N-acetyltransferase n=1 Tax=Polaribacter marinus TaxID=2916838 RepID=A0A9X2AJY8_9FLAO|nr:GNAT family N-acetyltransferase [Polaribacter marinus]MCI2228883.1 GNAT family N-acetyltransferase [Polaribacter marinus]